MMIQNRKANTFAMHSLIAAGVLLALLAPGDARADYPTDRRAAMKLVQAGQHEAALEALLTMAQSASFDAQRADALEQAALCAAKLKQPDRAMTLARQIPIEANSRRVQMRLLLDARKHEALIEAFGADDLEAWPDAVAGEAHYLRGLAYFKLRQGEAAERELSSALARIGEGYSRGHAALTRAQNLQSLLKNPEAALAAYRELQVIESDEPFGWKYLTGITGEAEILRSQGKLDEAEAALKKVDIPAMKNGYWAAAMRAAAAELLVARGHQSAAVAMLEDALKVSTQDAQKAALQKRLDALKAEAK